MSSGHSRRYPDDVVRRARSRSSPTIQDVADLAGVSVAAAGRALGGYGSVRAEVRERVVAAAKELGYRSNPLARSMITGITHTLGLVVADIENPFFARVARGVADVAHRAGYEVLLVNSDEDLVTEQAAVRTLFDKRVDGLIVAPASDQRGTHLQEAVSGGTPVVLIDRTVEGLHADAIVADNESAARRAIGHLVGLGHRRIAALSSSGPIHTNRARLEGYLKGLDDAGIDRDERLVRLVDYSREAATREAMAVIDGTGGATAIFTTDNVMSIGTFEGIQRAGRRVPDEVSIIGFDDLEWTTIVRPPMTVIAQPVYEVGAMAARRLLERIGGDEGPVRTCVLETAFIVRGSTGPAPGAEAAD